MTLRKKYSAWTDADMVELEKMWLAGCEDWRLAERFNTSRGAIQRYVKMLSLPMRWQVKANLRAGQAAE